MNSLQQNPSVGEQKFRFGRKAAGDFLFEINVKKPQKEGIRRELNFLGLPMSSSLELLVRWD